MGRDELMDENGNSAQRKADPMYKEYLQDRQGGHIPTFAKPGMTQRFMEAIQVGASIDAACWSIGVSATLFSGWERMADEGSILHERFVSMVRQARAVVETEVTGLFLQSVRANALADHRAPMQFLERYNPNGWATATRAKNEVTLDIADDPQRLLGRLLPEAFGGGTAEEDGPAES